MKRSVPHAFHFVVCHRPDQRKLLEVQTIPESLIELAPCQVAKEISEEVRLLRLCDHPNIVKYFASFTTGCDVTSTLWIVMELCRGVFGGWLQGVGPNFTGSLGGAKLAPRPFQIWNIAK